LRAQTKANKTQIFFMLYFFPFFVTHFEMDITFVVEFDIDATDCSRASLFKI
jgi:hypothetical protein